MSKRVTAKIYDISGTTLKSVFEVLNDFVIYSSINGGVGSLNIEIPARFGELSSALIDFVDHVKIYEQSKSNPNGKLIYSGYVDVIAQASGNNRERTKITLLGYHTRLTMGLLRDTTTLQVVKNSKDTGLAFREVITSYIANEGNPFITADTTSAPNSGVNFSYTFNSSTYDNAIDIIRKASGANYYWLVDVDNKAYFKEYSSTPIHKFIYGTNLTSIETESETSTVVNNVLFTNGIDEADADSIAKRYYNATSQTSYFARWKVITDARVTNTATARSISESEMLGNLEPNKSLTFDIIDNSYNERGYDISKIKVGDTCKIANIEPSNVIGDNMVITSTATDGFVMTIQVQDLRTSTARELRSLRKEIETQRYYDGVTVIDEQVPV